VYAWSLGFENDEMGLKGSICTMVGGQDEGRKCAVKF
jgi:hypothetical protein